MSRKKGLLNISANFEPQIASPFDSRTVVDTFSDLTNPSTFVSTDSNSYVYKGLVVSVVNDPGAGNGVYLLKGLPSTDESNWEKLGSSMPIDTPEYDAGATYNVGDVIVYISPQAEFLPEGDPFKEEYLYKCLAEANAGESPETWPEKWERLGKLSDVSNSIILIANVLGLQDSLNERVKYTDIGSNLSVTSEKKVNVNISYVTVNNYSPAEDIVATPEEEVTINGVIWKTKNETWTDGGTGIFQPMYDANTPAPLDPYGYLYTPAAAQRLIAANPGYRLFNTEDIKDTFGNIPRTEGARSLPDRIKVPVQNSYLSSKDFWGDPVMWADRIWDSLTYANLTGLGLVESGKVVVNESETSPNWETISSYFAKGGKARQQYLGESFEGNLEENNFIVTSYAGDNRAYTRYFIISATYRYPPRVNNSLRGDKLAYPVRLVKDI